MEIDTSLIIDKTLVNNNNAYHNVDQMRINVLTNGFENLILAPNILLVLTNGHFFSSPCLS
jgi:hypothetical protein